MAVGEDTARVVRLLLQTVKPRNAPSSSSNFEASRSAACLRNAASYGEKDLLHLEPELFSIDGTALVVVELVEDEIVEMGELFGRGGHVDPKVALDEPHRLESFSELSSGENIILVEI
ncbi:hypothetical protein F8388_005722 [Cannabis sativa]|uniref:Uncharacterized protein n=1 Tax=Cannabis sativa TaxID=3483 RepID=A0A7J6HSQ2_CANSA|nr:hypothetical protein F8388_005722 [Cannabis sativa]KAF4397708.1 hypothetical protein G4B88_027577 [Cannabis sativa]